MLSQDNVINKIIDKLQLLEYRGYDSAGIGFVSDCKIKTVKSIGRVNKLANKAKSLRANCVVAHTRWATHGKPTENNCHPHISKDNSWAVVHNGIITNIDELKKYIGEYSYYSDTDTEVIVALLSKCNPTNPKELSQCISRLEGTYAIVCINNEHPSRLYATKKFSPLYVGIGQETTIASDTMCFESNSIYHILEDNEYVIAEGSQVKFYNKKGYRIKKKSNVISNTHTDCLNNETHNMLTEIKQTKSVLLNLIDNAKKFCINFWQYNKIYFIGCGSAYNSALLAKYYLGEYGFDIECDRASEFVCNKHNFDNASCVFISQSGETADTILACKHVLAYGVQTIAITNNPNSYLNKICHQSFPIMAGREVAVASTKAYTSQISIMKLLADNICNNFNLEKWNSVLRAIDDINTEKLQNLSRELTNISRAFFLGKGLDYNISIEASLKLKEVSYINCSAYPSGELKHGPLALIEEGDIVIVSATQFCLIDKTNHIINEVKSRGGKVIVFSQYDAFQIADKFVCLPQVDDDMMPIVATVAFQYFAYYVSISKGINPDRPRNLAKSVTVE